MSMVASPSFDPHAIWEGEEWSVTGFDRDLDDWHGATVVSTEDGATIGLFLVTRDGALVGTVPRGTGPEEPVGIRPTWRGRLLSRFAAGLCIVNRKV
jgi:hypothetical protein